MIPKEVFSETLLGFLSPVRRDLDGLGRFVLTQEAQQLARLANVETPRLRTHDRQGRRIDLVITKPHSLDSCRSPLSRCSTVGDSRSQTSQRG